MRTKNLLLSAAALVAGALSAQAQSNVYSVNIVGYVNVPLAANVQTLVATPLDNSGSNDLNSLLGTLPNKSSVQVWNGTTFVLSTKGGSPSVWSPNLSVPPGTGYFVKSATAFTNTYVGSTSMSNSIAPVGGVFSLVGSPIPFSGNLNDAGSNSLNTAIFPNKSSIQTWNGTTYTLSTKGGSPSAWSPNLPINVGQGFFIKPASTTNWAQQIQ